MGIFGLYKYWYQYILYREISDGITNFGKSNFLTHLLEAQNRTFKRSVIIEAWQKCGIFPFDPSIMLGQLKDPLSSLAGEVLQKELPGYVREGTAASDCTLPPVQLSGPQTPPSRPNLSWNDVDTPPYVCARLNAIPST